MFEFTGRTAVVTGGASGIGLALTRRLLHEGMRVALGDVEAGALETAVAALVDEFGAPSVTGVVTDVGDEAAVVRLADEAASTLGPVRLVCANAGVTTSAATWESTPDDWAWLWQVNVLGVVHCVRTFVPRLIADGEPAHVCITGSLAGYLNQPGFGAYNASKHAVTAIAETLAGDLAQAGHPIGVTILAPWFVQPRLAQSARNRPTDLAEAAPVSDFTKQIWSTLTPYRDLSQTPEEIADQAVDAVRDGVFSVFPFAPSRDAVRERFEAVLDGRSLGLYVPDPTVS